MLQVVVESDFLFVARQDLPVTTADDLAALARANGGSSHSATAASGRARSIT